MTQEQLHNTYMTYLMVSNDGKTWEKLIDIKDFPDLGSAPNSLDATTLSDAMHTYIKDIMDTGGALEFTANYTLAGYKAVRKYEDDRLHWGLWFGGEVVANKVEPKGQFGKFEWEGTMACWKKGAGVGAVQEMGIAITPETEVKLAEDAVTE